MTWKFSGEINDSDWRERVYPLLKLWMNGELKFSMIRSVILPCPSSRPSQSTRCFWSRPLWQLLRELVRMLRMIPQAPNRLLKTRNLPKSKRRPQMNKIQLLGILWMYRPFLRKKATERLFCGTPRRSEHMYSTRRGPRPGRRRNRRSKSSMP